MATIIQLKRSSSGNAPNTTILSEAELAYSQDRSSDGANAILYIKSFDSGSNPVIQKVGGKYYTDIIESKPWIPPFNQANVAFAQANVAFTSANIAFAHAGQAFEQANSALLLADTAENYAISAFNQANTARLQANVAFGQANAAYDKANTGINIYGNGGVLATGLGSSLTIAGYNGIATNASGTELAINLSNTAVSAGSYGGVQNGIALVIDASGRITSAVNTNMSSNLTINGNGGTDVVVIGQDSLTVVGTGGGISTSVTDNVISIVNTGVKTVTAGVGLSTDTASGNITLVNTGVRKVTSAGHGIVFDASTGNITATFTGVGNIAGTANEIEVNQGSGNVTIGLPNDVTIGNDLTVSGNLYVLGDAVNINTSTITIEDPLVKFGNVSNPSDSLDIGFYGQYTSSGAKYAGLYRDHADSGIFKLFKDLATDPVSNVITEANYTLATLKANLTAGNITNLVNAIAVNSGGTGRKTLTANAVLYGDGTNQVALATGTAGQVLQLTTDGMVAFGGIDGGTF